MTTTPYTDLDAANARIAALEAQLNAECAAHAQTRDRLAKCNAAYMRLEKRNAHMLRYIREVRETLENTTLRDRNKIALIGLKAEYEHAADAMGVDPDPAEGEPEMVPILMTRLAKRIGCKPEGAGDRVRDLEKIGVARRQEVHSGGRTRIMAAPLRQAQIAPAEVKAKQPTVWGGMRCPDPDCNSPRLRVTVTRQVVCEDCGRIISSKTRHRLLNPDARVDHPVANLATVGEGPVGPLAAAAGGDPVANLANVDDPADDDAPTPLTSPIELFPRSCPAPAFSCRFCASEGIDAEWRWYDEGECGVWRCGECDRPAPGAGRGMSA